MKYTAEESGRRETGRTWSKPGERVEGVNWSDVEDALTGSKRGETDQTWETLTNRRETGHTRAAPGGRVGGGDGRREKGCTLDRPERGRAWAAPGGRAEYRGPPRAPQPPSCLAGPGAGSCATPGLTPAHVVRRLANHQTTSPGWSSHLVEPTTPFVRCTCRTLV